MLGGWLPIYFTRKDQAVYDGRMKAMVTIAVFPLVVLAAQPLGHISYWIPVLLIGVGASAARPGANIFTTVSDMFPKKPSDRWLEFGEWRVVSAVY